MCEPNNRVRIKVSIRVRVSFTTGAVRSAVLATAGLLVPIWLVCEGHQLRCSAGRCRRGFLDSRCGLFTVTYAYNQFWLINLPASCDIGCRFNQTDGPPLTCTCLPSWAYGGITSGLPVCACICCVHLLCRCMKPGTLLTSHSFRGLLQLGFLSFSPLDLPTERAVCSADVFLYFFLMFQLILS